MKGIPEIMLSRIVMFMWSVGALYVAGWDGRQTSK